MDGKTFQDLKPKIAEALNKRGKEKLKIEEDITLIDGFVWQPIQDHLKGVVLGGRAIPMVVAVGDDSGRLYFFALKQLLEEKEF